MPKNDPTAGSMSPEDLLEREIDLDALEKIYSMSKERDDLVELDLKALITEAPTGSAALGAEMATEEEVRFQSGEEVPAPVRLRTVSGSYTGSKGDWDLDLRIDEEKEIADAYFDADQGSLFWIEDSPSPKLSKGMDRLYMVMDKYPDHRLTHYARKTVGMNLIRGFKAYAPATGRLSINKPDLAAGVAQIDPVIAAIESHHVYDNIELRKMTQRIAQAEMRAGVDKGAKSRLNRLVKSYEKMKLSPPILAQIKAQVTQTLDQQ